MIRKPLLTDALHRLGDELRDQQPPPAVWAGVRATFESLRPPPRRRRRWPVAWSGAAASAAVLAASALLMLRPPEPPAAVAQPPGFVSVASAERWAEARREGPAWLVSAELPAERLAELGLPYDPAHAGQRVRAELLLHPAGDVLAVRFLQ